MVASGATAGRTTADAAREHEQMEPVELLANADRHLEAGELQEAETLYEEAARRLGHRHALALDNLALIYRLRGDVHRAKQRLEETIDILVATKARDTPYHARALTNLGAVYLELGDHRGALRCYRKARHILNRSAPGSVLLARTLDGMGAVFREEHDYGHALRFHRQALKIFEALRPGTPDVARALFNVGLTYSAWSNLVGSLEYFERARDILEAFAPRSPDLAGVLSHIGAVHLMLREPHLALPAYERAIDILKAVAPRSPSMATALTGLALIHRDRGDHAQAIPHLLRAVGIADSLREQAASPEDRAEVFARHESPYQALIGCLYARGDLGDAEEAFDLAEASRARALVELLAEVEHFSKEGARLRGETAEQRELLEHQHELQDKLAANYKGLVRARQFEDAKRLQELGARDHELKAALRAVRARIRAAFPAYAEVRYPRPLTIQQVRSRLDPQTLLLAFDATGDEAFVWAVRHKDFGMFRISAGGDRLAELVKAAVGRYRAEQPSDARVRAAHDELSRLLLEPVPGRFWNGVEFVIVIPDAHLHYLPLEVLSAPDANDPLVERYAVAYAPSATALDGLARRSATTASRGEFVGFGHALPSARGEVEAIARAFEARGATSLGPYLDRDATELRAKSESAGVRFVHFATHGEFNDERPELSGLHLAAPLPEEKATDARADDFLQVYEMFDLRLSAEAVICSSCETGLGNVNPGEGMVGMSQALFFAGARCVVVTLWPVRDEPTRELMESFYGYLVEGYSLAESLRAAKRDVRRWFPDPYYWAAFVAVGAAWDPASGAPAAKLESRDDLRRFLGRIREWRLDDKGWAEAQRSLERFGVGLDEVREALSTLAALSASRLPPARFGQHAAPPRKQGDPTRPPPDLVLEELNKLVHGLK